MQVEFIADRYYYNFLMMIHNNISEIKQKINDTAILISKNPQDIKLLAVTKTLPAETVRKAVEAGLLMFGENRVQEAREKTMILQSIFPDRNIQWHLIGNLQKNKAKYAVQLFDLIHTVDSAELADILNREAHKIGKIQNLLVQVKLSDEETKHGISEQETRGLVKHITGLTNLRLLGLMTIPPFFEDPEDARPYFSKLRLIRDTIECQEGISLPELSMGMSHDFEAAIQEGATIIRIGTAIFGQRR
ncbi:MAG: YggS family pyridoxal phosphate-dependent enzyme [Dissulfurispiraceae bacterium]|jgi:pyridoxal phosphate enzyme (YggS family)|nr:YggS family pyridoxal phosphate-dependent enzyme [Dissulfurispiraceae bacterium]